MPCKLRLEYPGAIYPVYDRLGQVTSGKRSWQDGTAVAGQQFEYAFDDIGNRTSTGAGGDKKGLNLRNAAYTPNNLNQYSSRTVPGAVDVMGVVLATNTVTVNSLATYLLARQLGKTLPIVQHRQTETPVFKDTSRSSDLASSLRNQFLHEDATPLAQIAKISVPSPPALLLSRHPLCPGALWWKGRTSFVPFSRPL